MALNSLAVLAAVTALGLPLEPALARLEHFCPLPGRGEECTIAIGGKNVNIIDDAYNANPGSMIAALENLSSRKAAGRKIAVLGEMAELGPQAENYHSELATLVERLDIDSFHVVGKLYENFWEHIPDARKGSFAGSLDVLRGTLLDVCDEGDLVLLKGSHSTRIHQVAAWLKEQRYGQPR
ncbi:UDP-N-acetylmuramoyl-tripeptide--D-alanyl-D-alanine ligase [compost metagenome]